MRNFIRDYIDNPSKAISDARNAKVNWPDEVDEEMIYAQLSTPEFRLYEEILLSSSYDEASPANYIYG